MCLVRQVSGNHIAILVLGLFNANIGRPALADSFSFVSKPRSWYIHTCMYYIHTS